MLNRTAISRDSRCRARFLRIQILERSCEERRVNQGGYELWSLFFASKSTLDAFTARLYESNRSRILCWSLLSLSTRFSRSCTSALAEQGLRASRRTPCKQSPRTCHDATQCLDGSAGRPLKARGAGTAFGRKSLKPTSLPPGQEMPLWWWHFETASRFYSILWNVVSYPPARISVR